MNALKIQMSVLIFAQIPLEATSAPVKWAMS